MNNNTTEQLTTTEGRFYKLPKALIYNEKYADLSANTLLVYQLLLDRFSLSKANKEDWRDSKGRIYCVFTVKELLDLTGMSRGTINKAKKDLNDAGLIEELPTKHANRFYVNEPEEVVQKTTCSQDEESCIETESNSRTDEFQNLDANDTELNNLKDLEINNINKNGRAPAHSKQHAKKQNTQEPQNPFEKPDNYLSRFIEESGLFDKNFSQTVVYKFRDKITPRMVAKQIGRMDGEDCPYPKTYFIKGIHMQIEENDNKKKCQGTSLSKGPQPRNNQPEMNTFNPAMSKVLLHNWLE